MSNNAPAGADYDPRAPWYDSDEEPVEYEPEYDPDDERHNDDDFE